MKRKLVVLAVLFACIAVWMFLRDNGSRDGSASISVALPMRGLPGDGTTSASESNTDRNAPTVTKPKRSVEPVSEERTQAELRKEVKTFLANCEAARSKIIAQIRSGPSTVYLLSVAPPSQNEMRSTREKISELSLLTKVWQQKGENGAENYQRFDQWAGEQVKRYGSFNQFENKAMVITVHDDPKMPMVGFTFTTQDYDKEVERFTNGTTEFEFENMVSYGRNDGEILERFRALMD